MSNPLFRASATSRTALIGGLAAISLTVAGAALAAPGGLLLSAAPGGSPSASPASSPLGEDGGKPARPAAHPTTSPVAETEASPEARSCPWPVPTPSATPTVTPTATAMPHDQGLHCGWYKPGRAETHRDGLHSGAGNSGTDASSPRPRPTAATERPHGKPTSNPAGKGKPAG